MSDPQNQRVVLVSGSPLFGSRENILFPTALSVSLLHLKLYISVHQIQDLPLFDRHYQVQLYSSIEFEASTCLTKSCWTLCDDGRVGLIQSEIQLIKYILNLKLQDAFREACEEPSPCLVKDGSHSSSLSDGVYP